MHVSRLGANKQRWWLMDEKLNRALGEQYQVKIQSLLTIRFLERNYWKAQGMMGHKSSPDQVCNLKKEQVKFSFQNLTVCVFVSQLLSSRIL